MQNSIGPEAAVHGDAATLEKLFRRVRRGTEEIFSLLQVEDTVVQPVAHVSPPKWHLAHTTWFFETFFLKSIYKNYRPFDPDFNFLFNSYYESVGERVFRADRGNITRPGVERILDYRKFVNDKVEEAFDEKEISAELLSILELGLNHEMQHQELLMTDLKYILGHNPIFPAYDPGSKIDRIPGTVNSGFAEVEGGLYQVGFEGGSFSFDNESARHQVYLDDFEIARDPVTFGSYIQFIEDGGYEQFQFWHSDAWAWVNENKIKAPLYLHKIDGEWMRYTLSGLKRVRPDEILVHISWYEAAAFAAWKKMRLPTEFEWEVASDHFIWGEVWEWTNSAYLPYPGYKAAPGALGEYNGKFMVNQMVLRGGSMATPQGHSRKTYRNFFHPHFQWQFAGIRLAK